MAKNIMIDIETWGTGNFAVPISIGAVKFDGSAPVTRENSDAFHVGIVPATCIPFGLEMDADTIMWWMAEERTEARRVWLSLDKLDIATVLTSFMMWINAASPDDTAVWGNGATFDNVIMRNAFTKVLGPGTCPWAHWKDRCYRTMKNLGADVTPPPADPFGIAHDALSDALWQARHLQLIYQSLGLEL